MLEGKVTGGVGGGESIMSSFWRILSLRLWATSKWTCPGGSWKCFCRTEDLVNQDFSASVLMPFEAR